MHDVVGHAAPSPRSEASSTCGYTIPCELNAIWTGREPEKGGMNAHPVALKDAHEIGI